MCRYKPGKSGKREFSRKSGYISPLEYSKAHPGDNRVCQGAYDLEGAVSNLQRLREMVDVDSENRVVSSPATTLRTVNIIVLQNPSNILFGNIRDCLISLT